MTMQPATGLEDGLKRDVAVLSTLAHLHCATLSHIHALCFPFHTLATARLTLRYLAEANLIARSTWWLNHRTERGQVWVLKAKGNGLLQRYVAHVPALPRIDLSRPTTAVEQEEWRVRLQVRTLLVRLLAEARQTPVFHEAHVQLPWSAGWSTAWSTTLAPEPDACFTVVWLPATRKAADWLPWNDPELVPGNMICHPIFIERTHAATNLLESIPAWSQGHPEEKVVPIIVARDDEHCEQVVRHLQAISNVPPLRLASWTSLDDGLVRARLRNENGLPRALSTPCEKTVA